MIYVITVALFSAFIVLLLSTSGVRNTVIERCKYKIISKMFSCDFCLSFWVSVIVSFGAYFALRDIAILAIPFLSTPLTRTLL